MPSDAVSVTSSDIIASEGSYENENAPIFVNGILPGVPVVPTSTATMNGLGVVKVIDIAYLPVMARCMTSGKAPPDYFLDWAGSGSRRHSYDKPSSEF